MRPILCDASASIAIDNVSAEREDAALRDAVTQCAQDENGNTMVRDTTRHVLSRIKLPSASQDQGAASADRKRVAGDA